MKIDEAMGEAFRRWRDDAAIYKDSTSTPANYEVGYFERTSDGLLFRVMGSASTLKRAIADATKKEAEGVKRGASLKKRSKRSRPLVAASNE